ncbi:MAG: hypothetical protein ABIO96_09040 [Nitrospiraceae bacterium]
MFYNAEHSAPWCFRAPASHLVAPYLSPVYRHVTMTSREFFYHLPC